MPRLLKLWHEFKKFCRRRSKAGGKTARRQLKAWRRRNAQLQRSWTARSVRRAQARAVRHHKLERVRTLAAPGNSAIIAVMTVRDERLRLEDCLNHHRALGVDRFVIVDNASKDGTLEFLLEQPDIDVIWTDNSFAEAKSGLNWTADVLARYGFGRWYLTIDADELLVYDQMDSFDLHDLADLLQRHGSGCLYAPLIDMYSDKSLDRLDYRRGESMIAACPYFDGDSYQIRRGPRLRGGPRIRLLSRPEARFSHTINKHPFFFFDRSVARNSAHNRTLLHPVAEGSPTGALLHFKFLNDFAEKVSAAVAHKQHWQDSSQYRCYADGLAAGAFQTFKYPGSIAYEGPQSLIDCSLMTGIDWSLLPARSRNSRVS